MSVHNSFKKGIAICIESGIVSGRSEEILDPKGNISIAEVAVMIQRLLKKANLI